MKTVKSFCDRMNITYLQLLDRDSEIQITNQGLIKSINVKKFASYIDKPIVDFLKNDDHFVEFSETLKGGGKFVWKDCDLEDMVLSERKRLEGICKILKIKEYEEKKRKDLKEAIKKTLSNGLTKTELEELSAILFKFNEVDRLLYFLGHRSSFKTKKVEK